MHLLIHDCVEIKTYHGMLWTKYNHEIINKLDFNLNFIKSTNIKIEEEL